MIVVVIQLTNSEIKLLLRFIIKHPQRFQTYLNLNLQFARHTLDHSTKCVT